MFEVEYMCKYNRIALATDSGQRFFGREETVKPGGMVDIKSGRSHTLRCDLPVMFGGNKDAYIVDAVLEVVVGYRPWIYPKKFFRSYGYRTFRKIDKTLVWIRISPERVQGNYN